MDALSFNAVRFGELPGNPARSSLFLDEDQRQLRRRRLGQRLDQQLQLVPLIVRRELERLRDGVDRGAHSADADPRVVSKKSL